MVTYNLFLPMGIIVTMIVKIYSIVGCKKSTKQEDRWIYIYTCHYRERS